MTSLAAVLLWSALLIVLHIVLAARVSLERGRSKVGLGDGGLGADSALIRAMRAHGNFAENAPFMLALLLLLHLANAASLTISVIGAVFVISRIAYAVGVSGASGLSPGRGIGVAGTWGGLLVGAGILLVHAFA